MDALVMTGRLAGVVGVLICAFAAAVRLSGNYFFAGFQVGTLFLAGIAAMAAGCFLLLWSASARR